MAAKKTVSIRRRLFTFSALLLLIIFTAGSAVFFVTMRDIIRDSAHLELARSLEIERIKLESSVTGEIAIALKMAGSPIIIKHFLNPADAELKKIAFEEIAGYRKAFGSNTVFWISDADKKFYSDDSYVYTVDPKDPGNYWYPMTMNETDKYNFNINYNEQMKKIMLWINAVVKNDGKSVGIVGTGIDLSSFTDAIYKGYAGKADLYFFNALGEVTGAKNTELITEKKKIDAALGEELAKEIAELAKGLGKGETKTVSAGVGEISVTAVPTLEWYAFAVLPITREDYETPMTAFFVVVLAVIALIFIVFNVYIFGIVDPLRNMAKILRQTAIDWDLTRRLPVRRYDEIGTVSASVNDFFEKIRSIIEKIRANSGTIADASDELSSVSHLLADGSEKTVDSSHDVVSTMEQMAANISAMAGGAETASNSVKNIAGAAENMRGNMNTIDGAIRNMGERIGQIAGSTGEVRKISADATGKASGATDVMYKLNAAAKEIGKFTDVIKVIAKKTNLLALNATVEAARAGEAGKGFTVVAGEIKQLANQSAESANDITSRIESIQADTDHAAAVIGEVAGIITTINKSVEDIAVHINEQTKASGEIADSVTEANTNARLVADSLGAVAASANEVSHNANEAAIGAKNASHHAMNMHEAAQDGADGAEKVSRKAGDLGKIADELKETVSQFKV